MNSNAIVSQKVGEDLSLPGLDFVALKLTSTGVVRVTASTDRVIGTLIRGNVAPSNGQTIPTNFAPACDLELTIANGLVFIQLGAGITTAIAMGDELELDTTAGCYCKKTNGVARAVAWDSVPANQAGGQIRAFMLPEPSIVINAPTQTQTSLTDNSTGVVSTTVAAITSPTAVTNSSGGSTADTVIAAITNVGNAGSADVTPTANAIAKLAVLSNANAAAIIVLKNAVASIAAELALVKADNAALIAALKS